MEVEVEEEGEEGEEEEGGQVIRLKKKLERCILCQVQPSVVEHSL